MHPILCNMLGVFLCGVAALSIGCNGNNSSGDKQDSQSGRCSGSVTVQSFDVGPDTMVSAMVGPDTMTVTKVDCVLVVRFVGPDTMNISVGNYYSVTYRNH